jgi:hypothetical protein
MDLSMVGPRRGQNCHIDYWGSVLHSLADVVLASALIVLLVADLLISDSPGLRLAL